MNIAKIIECKRDGGSLATDEIAFVVREFAKDAAGDTTSQVKDYQMAALAMAIFFQGMDARETADLTREMVDSGTKLSWAGEATYVDKHSTGGVGDKVSLILAPLLACCGLRVPMISGRGLGPTGGTLDKLESIPGFNVNLSTAEMQRIADEVGCVISSASAELAPADKALYALRDVTATVPSVPLITASILSKKLAEGLDALVLDVKCGSGAFMKTIEDARALSHSLIHTGQQLGLRTTALITDMNQPLGRMIGNANEVNESLDALRDEGPRDLKSITCQLAASLLVSTKCVNSIEAGIALAEQKLSSGEALAKFQEMVSAQGGSLQSPRPLADKSDVVADRAGFVQSMDTDAIGYAVIEMGGGRRVAGEAIDFSVGLELLVRLGDQVDAGQPVAHLFCSDEKAAGVSEMIQSSLTIGDSPVSSPSLVLDRL